MVKFIVTGLCGLMVAGGTFVAVTHHGAGSEDCPACAFCDAPPSPYVADATASAPATNRTAAIDVKNTKCIVTGEDATEKTVEYQGKAYHICCNDCVADFNKDPAKYVKALEADPAKFGVKK